MYVVYVILAIAVVVAVMIARQRKKKPAKAETPKKPEPAGKPVEIIGSTPESIAVTYYVDGEKKEGTVKMAQGLQVFRADGSIDLDITENLVKVIATLDIAGNGGSYSNDMLKNANVWYLFIIPTISQAVNLPSSVTVSDGKISWSSATFVSAGAKKITPVSSGVQLVVGVC